MKITTVLFDLDGTLTKEFRFRNYEFRKICIREGRRAGTKDR